MPSWASAPRRRKVRYIPFLPYGKNFICSLAPPFPTETACAEFRREPCYARIFFLPLENAPRFKS